MVDEPKPTDPITENTKKAVDAVTGLAAPVTETVAKQLHDLAPKQIEASTVKTAMPWLAGGAVAALGTMFFSPIQSATKSVFRLFKSIPIIGTVMEAVGEVASYVGVALASFVTFKMFETKTPPIPKVEEIRDSTGQAAAATAGAATVIMAPKPSNILKTNQQKESGTHAQAPIQKPSLQSDKPRVQGDFKNAMSYALGNEPENQPSARLKAAAESVNKHPNQRNQVIEKYHNYLDTLPKNQEPAVEKLSQIIEEVGNKPPSLGDKVAVKIEALKTKIGVAGEKTKQFVTGAPRPGFVTTGNMIVGADGVMRLATGDTTLEKVTGGTEVATGVTGLLSQAAQRWMPHAATTARLSSAANSLGGVTGGLLAPIQGKAAYDSFTKKDAGALDYIEGTGHAAGATGGGALFVSSVAVPVVVVTANAAGYTAVAASATAVGTGATAVATVAIPVAIVVGTGVVVTKAGIESYQLYHETAAKNEGLRKLESGAAYEKLQDAAQKLAVVARSYKEDMSNAGLVTETEAGLQYDLGSVEKMEKLRTIIKERIAAHQKDIDAHNGRWRAYLPHYTTDQIEANAITATTNQAGAKGHLKVLDELIAETKKGEKILAEQKKSAENKATKAQPAAPAPAPKKQETPAAAQPEQVPAAAPAPNKTSAVTPPAKDPLAGIMEDVSPSLASFSPSASPVGVGKNAAASVSNVG